MKKINKYLVIIGAMFLAVSCVDLDTAPEGSTMKDDQKKEILLDDPSQLEAEINGLNAILIYTGVDASGDHSDFGYPAMALYMDSNGPDMPAIEAGYNHFSGDAAFTARLAGGSHTWYTWRTLYDYIDTANNLINLTVEIDPNSPYKDLYESARGNAFAARAWAYHTLVQLCQFRYVDNKTELAVPLVYSTSELEGEEGLLKEWGISMDDYVRNGKRETVEDIYKLILSDLREAIDLLNGSKYKRSMKSTISASVAYGIRARVNLTMENWGDAAADAESAITAAKAESLRLTTIDDVSKPTFQDAASGRSIMWAAIVTPQNRAATTGIVNYTSMICSFYSPGYAVGGGVLRKINSLLYNVIPDSDVRKGWWLNAEKKSPNLPDGVKGPEQAYANIKFAPFEEDYNTVIAAVDFIMMRLEEMELIKAEALAMSGDATGVTTLVDWVKTYRDPDYVFESGDKNDIQNEIWKHRRIEFWGEGITWFDIMRLEKPVLRFVDDETVFDDNFKFNVKEKSDIMLWRIPQGEIDANGALDNTVNKAENYPTPGSGSDITFDGVTGGIAN